MDAQADTTDHRGSITKDVPSLRIDHITESPLLGVWRGHGLNAVVSQQRNELFIHHSPTRFSTKGHKNMKTIKFVVKVNRGGSRAPQYVQRVEPTPIHMTTNRKLALVMGRFMAEDAVKSLQTSRCIPELESVQVGA
jgi:hypothetical protein